MYQCPNLEVFLLKKAYHQVYHLNERIMLLCTLRVFFSEQDREEVADLTGAL